MIKKLKCYACVDDDCEAFVDQAPLLCDDAILVRLNFHPNNSSLICSTLFVLLIAFFSQCLKWRMRYTDGSTRIGRGCISDDVVPFYACNEPSIYLHTECCHEDLCNGGLFPVLPDLPLGEMGLIVWSLCFFYFCLRMMRDILMIRIFRD